MDLEVLGLGFGPIDEPPKEIPHLPEGEEETITEERGERGQVRQPHHRFAAGVRLPIRH